MLRSYLRHRQFLFLWTAVVLIIFLFLQYLYWYPLASIGYTALIVVTVLAIITAFDYRSYRSRLNQLDALEEAWISLGREMPDTQDPLEQRYQQLILKQREILTFEKQKQLTAQQQREELVTMWMHQIKLPLASLSLIIESLEPDDILSASHLNEMKLALMRTEQYAQTALKAIQIENLKEDLILEPCDLGGTLRGSDPQTGASIYLEKAAAGFHSISPDRDHRPEMAWLHGGTAVVQRFKIYRFRNDQRNISVRSRTASDHRRHGQGYFRSRSAAFV